VSPFDGAISVSIEAANIDPAEIEKFSRIADEWWDPNGKFRPLHKFNPARLGFIRDTIATHFGKDAVAARPLEGLSLIDIGCGGGLVSEPMRRLGADVLGIDASARNISVAQLHASRAGLAINYRATSVESLAVEGGPRFDVVLNLEVVEHVPDVRAFIADSARLLHPSGLMIVATINRTLKAFALAKVGAEYVLGWLPRGSHDPRRFVTPDELQSALAAAGLAVSARAGVAYNPIADRWRVVEDLSVNYMIAAARQAA
jgi:2-polyprenyl-6-hydroxyphenyl methylase/3-demethylubiquinone-9 3-methyltransferase